MKQTRLIFIAYVISIAIFKLHTYVIITFFSCKSLKTFFNFNYSYILLKLKRYTKSNIDINVYRIKMHISHKYTDYVHIGPKYCTICTN